MAGLTGEVRALGAVWFEEMEESRERLAGGRKVQYYSYCKVNQMRVSAGSFRSSGPVYVAALRTHAAARNFQIANGDSSKQTESCYRRGNHRH